MVIKNWDVEPFSIGLEVEFTQILRDSESFKRDINNIPQGHWAITHDGSVEGPETCLGLFPVAVPDVVLPKFIQVFGDNHNVFGGELLSGILPNDPGFIKEQIYNACMILSKYSESETSNRDSFHVHVNVGNGYSLRSIQRLLYVCTAAEKILYRLGGMGRYNRGVDNDFIFCRPYSGKGPQVVKKGSAFYPIVSYDDLMESRSKLQFFDRLGSASQHAAAGHKYVTHRYMGINFHPYLVLGTIEWRHCNKVLRPEWALAWVMMCQKITELCMAESTMPIVQSHTLDEKEPVSDVIFEEFISSLGLSTANQINLNAIWNSTPDVSYDNKYRTSHLEEPTFFVGEYITTPLEKGTKVERSRAIHARDVAAVYKNRIEAAARKLPRDNDDPFINKIDGPLKLKLIDVNAVAKPDRKNEPVEYVFSPEILFAIQHDSIQFWPCDFVNGDQVMYLKVISASSRTIDPDKILAAAGNHLSFKLYQDDDLSPFVEYCVRKMGEGVFIVSVIFEGMIGVHYIDIGRDNFNIEDTLLNFSLLKEYISHGEGGVFNF